MHTFCRSKIPGSFLQTKIKMHRSAFAFSIGFINDVMVLVGKGVNYFVTTILRPKY